MVVDVESYASRAAIERLVQQLPNGGEGLVIAVFYLGANTTSVTVMHDGEAIYEREQPFGGQQLTGDISRTYGIPTEEAEQKKRSGDLPARLGGEEFAVLLEALESKGVVRTLAEPNLTAVSGESARFLAGGDGPVEHADVVALLTGLLGSGLDFIKTEHLYTFDGVPGFSLGQGQ